MFDFANPLVVGASVPGADGIADLIVANRTARMRIECELLVLAALWADAHDPQMRIDPGDRCRCWGGDGTPQVTEYAHDELGTLLHTSGQTAAMLMADALDLRHRLPETWDRVKLGTIRAFQARAVAQATRHLPPAAAMTVDDTLARHWGLLPWPRLRTLLDAAILDADPELADQRAAAADTERFVRTGRTTEHGLKLFIAKANAGDVIFVMAMINRLADILHRDGDTTPVDVRRATALGILANPARALQLLIDHTTDPHSAADDGGEAEPDPDGDDHRTITIPGQVPIHPRRLAPTATVYIHLTDRALTATPGHSPVARVEDVGPVTLTQVRRFLDRPDLRIRIQPVIDPATTAPADAYEIPHRLREAVRLRHLTDTFPYATCDTRAMDLDHTTPHHGIHPGGGGPTSTGPTSTGNLSPLTRHHHRAKTHGRWHKRQPDPDTVIWRSPHGWIYLVTPQGTLDLGPTPYAHAVWRAAQAPPAADRHDKTERTEVELAS